VDTTMLIQAATQLLGVFKPAATPGPPAAGAY
jgi:hypothetical protein